jgi:hypothetical protein
VLSFLEKSNYGDVRTLEIANKRLEQFQGIIGMSDQIFGNFGADVAEVIRTNARHKMKKLPGCGRQTTAKRRNWSEI